MAGPAAVDRQVMPRNGIWSWRASQKCGVSGSEAPYELTPSMSLTLVITIVVHVYTEAIARYLPINYKIKKSPRR